MESCVDGREMALSDGENEPGIVVFHHLLIHSWIEATPNKESCNNVEASIDSAALCRC